MMKKTKKGASLVIVVLGVLCLLAFSSFVIDVGLLLNTQNQLQKAVETSALIGAQGLEIKNTGLGLTVDMDNVKNTVKQAFDSIKSNNSLIANAVMDDTDTKYLDFKVKSKAVRVYATVDSPTYFLNILGINKITVEAQAAAMSAPFYLTSSSVAPSTNLDSFINEPVGEGMNVNDNYDNITSYPDNKALSLGAGGHLLITLPIPIVDNDGADLYIRELGNAEGYFVFAGIDKDPQNPFVNSVFPGGGIQWINISCTGKPIAVDTSNTKVGAYSTTVHYLKGGTADLTRTESKFYGSGLFDLSASCNNPDTYNASISSAKYLKIIDDNAEDGFMEDDKSEPVFIAGEHSSATPGADIDSIAVLNHARLIKVSDFNTDSDKDELIDILEKIIGTNISMPDSDGDGISDTIEYLGWGTSSSNDIISSPSSIIHLTNSNKAKETMEVK